MYSFVSDSRGDKVLSNAFAWKLVSGNEICIATGYTGVATVEYHQGNAVTSMAWPFEAIFNRTRAGVNLVYHQGENTNKNTGKSYYHIDIMVIMWSVDDRYRRP